MGVPVERSLYACRVENMPKLCSYFVSFVDLFKDVT